MCSGFPKRSCSIKNLERDGLIPSRSRREPYLVADAACAGLPKTLRQPSLRLARCLRMQAVIRSTLGISEEQSRSTSGVQSCLASSWVKAWLAAGEKAQHAAMHAASCSPLTQNSFVRIVPLLIDRRCGLPSRRFAAPESMHDGRREFFHLNVAE